MLDRLVLRRADVTAYALVLASAFLHAAWNALVKKSADPTAAVHAVVAAAGVVAAAVAVEVVLPPPLPSPQAMANEATSAHPVAIIQYRMFNLLISDTTPTPIQPTRSLRTTRRAAR